MSGFHIAGRIEVEQRWGQYRQQTSQRLEIALAEWAGVAHNAIVSHETRVGDASSKRKISPGRHLRDSFKVSTVFGGLKGRVAGDRLASGLYILVYTPNPNAIWQEKGTLGRRRAKLKNQTYRSSALGASRYAKVAGRSGIKPLYFMRDGLREAYPFGVALVQKALS